MSYAIYGESETYVFLVTGETPAHAVSEFIADVKEMGVALGNVYNVYAVNGRHEDKELEDAVEAIIKQSV